ncbi:MAG: WecB/TagA/CpsF family glycosyltransferase [Pseudomonadota bacterium]
MTIAPYESLIHDGRAAEADAVERVVVGGLPVARMTRDEQACHMVESWALAKAAGVAPIPKVAFSVNGHTISLYHSSPAYREALDQADLLDADGMSVVFASRTFSRSGLPERVATTDFFHDAARRAQEAGMSFYFLGAREQECAEAVETVRRMYPDLRIAGWRHGYFSREDEPQICSEIVASGADMLWIGCGAPVQEQFAIRNRERLQGLAWIKTCGGLFDFLSGKNPRAPKWMQQAGLEFAYRTWREPRRLFWRYFITSPHAIYHLATNTRSV